MLTLTMPQSEPSAARNRSASRWSQREDATTTGPAERRCAGRWPRRARGRSGPRGSGRTSRAGPPRPGPACGPGRDARSRRSRARAATRSPPATTVPPAATASASASCIRAKASRGEQRSDEGAVANGSPTRQAPVDVGHAIDEPVRHRLVHDQPAQRRAPLAGRAGGGEHDAAHGEVQVGGRRDDRGVVAAELQQGPPEAGGDPWCDRGAHALGSGGADERDEAAVDERPGAFGVGDDDGVQPLRRALLAGRAVEQRGRGNGGERGHVPRASTPRCRRTPARWRRSRPTRRRGS